jgi:hypothetical protein
MNVRTKIRSGQTTVTTNTAANINQRTSVSLTGNGVNVANALNVGVGVSVGVGVATGVSNNLSLTISVNA